MLTNNSERRLVTTLEVRVGCWFLFAVLVIVCRSVAGCSSISRSIKSATEPTWHEKFDWEAEDYFDDEKVIALCHAIEANDLEEIDRLIAGYEPDGDNRLWPNGVGG